MQFNNCQHEGYNRDKTKRFAIQSLNTVYMGAMTTKAGKSFESVKIKVGKH